MTTTRGHHIDITRGTDHIRVEVNGRLLADSHRPLLLAETGYPVRYYLPPEDVRTDLLTPSKTHTFCPFKGTASYWSLAGGPLDIAWAYPEPRPGVAQIKDHLCFYEVELG
ncbi:DUF427 domain-containing protein [Streptomyces sp. NPDC048483]|uniref:DUF427 domain-containing protein n=1 Tax=Streptomyces sp. NPDC048483 TaxID=3154927 RepID=UPI003424431E